MTITKIWKNPNGISPIDNVTINLNLDYDFLVFEITYYGLKLVRGCEGTSEFIVTYTPTYGTSAISAGGVAFFSKTIKFTKTYVKFETTRHTVGGSNAWADYPGSDSAIPYLIYGIKLKNKPS